MAHAVTVFFVCVGVIAVVAVVALFGWRHADRRADAAAWRALLEIRPIQSGSFSPDMVAGLPEPAQRYFLYTIAEGTPLRTITIIEMEGQLGRGDSNRSHFDPMQACQVLAPPHGFVWQVRAGAIRGSDAATPDISWTRFWLFGLVPVVRISGDADHFRSAFGRTVAEAAFWTPAALLPGPNVRWEALDADSARAIVSFAGLEQSVDIIVDSQGQPTSVVIARWSDVNADKVYQVQPFGGTTSDFREFGGYRLPTRIEGGNWFGTDDYFPFFKADVTSISFPGR
ncbi:hypothetical protein DEM25_014180 [Oceaniradius stylonematis]|uniref:Uncharacterized protein n=1 Tax=Oceaniradius stylonematis TaxID=2184161 RepID=A0A3A8AJ78_9HYPH|nr:DUF6544 family protein [Oceaniradius stylonematis]RKF05741.1 hypothetical protein DEM25_014180 [Oceaniradius stylonematis]